MLVGLACAIGCVIGVINTDDTSSIVLTSKDDR